MEIIHINNSNDVDKLEIVRKYVEEGKDVYVLVYMVGCGACDIVHPEWNKIKQEVKEDDLLNNSNIIVVDINKEFLDHPNNTFIKDETIAGYPTLLFLGKGKKDELKASLPDSKIIVNWIKKNSLGEKQMGEKQMGGKSRKMFHKRGKMSKKRQSRKSKKRGGKWSLKYKKSINCKHPHGFSQKQHCKYGRKAKK
jgi:thiol-disulfide isomerase/thioredoxin